MSDNDKHYIGAIGTFVKLHTEVDLTGYETIVIYCKRPSGTVFETVTWTDFEIQDPITDGILYHVTVAGDFSEAGFYTCWCVVDFLDGRHHTSEADTFKVWNAGE